MTWRIPLSDLEFGPEEENAVLDVIHSRWLTMGSATQDFEKAFADYLDVKHAIAVANGTAALHLACLALEIGPGDEVIVPSLTFVATANAVRYTGAIPVFADITSHNDLNIDPQSIEQLISEKTRAIIVVHYGGYACDMPRVNEIAINNNIAVIEDAAHAIGSELNDRKLGTWGKVGCFSFFSNKNMTTGEGGMLVTEDDELAEKLRLLRSHGMTSMTWDRHKGHAWSYDVIALGYNYRIDEIRASLGLVQLGKLETNNDKRRQLTNLYRDLILESAPTIIVPFKDHPGLSASHIMPVILPSGINRFDFMDHMKARGIQTSIHYPPIHKFTAYENDIFTSNLNLNITEDVAHREVTLPLYPSLQMSEVKDIVGHIQESLQK
ncbi:MAG: DegT/DnrJ/EryC1/StrS aminotransferase family protein [Anaerolineales bacterium]|nr:DegT/DnrJ/EryC1/StrS aminotransferase family protein [Anaerolineales bacterium]